jgi:hypothetical protein
VYNATPNKEPFYAEFFAPGSYYAWHSIGIGVKKDGTISDVVPGTPAYDAGLDRTSTKRKNLGSGSQL